MMILFSFLCVHIYKLSERKKITDFSLIRFSLFNFNWIELDREIPSRQPIEAIESLILSRNIHVWFSIDKNRHFSVDLICAFCISIYFSYKIFLILKNLYSISIIRFHHSNFLLICSTSRHSNLFSFMYFVCVCVSTFTSFIFWLFRMCFLFFRFISLDEIWFICDFVVDFIFIFNRY